MKPFKLYLIILVVFLKTGNVLSNNNIFNVNNVEIEKKVKSTNEFLANQAIKKGFTKLTDKILLKGLFVFLTSFLDTFEIYLTNLLANEIFTPLFL